MKKNLLLITFAMILSLAHSQDYNFSVTNGTYSNLTESTSLNNGMTWDDPQFQVPIGFSFEYFNTAITELFISGWGYGGELTTSESAEGTAPYLSPFGSDLIDRGYDFFLDTITSGSLSNISYKLDGTAGSRVLKIEWNNAGFFSDIYDDFVSTDFVNFQLWLYEGSNDIEIHFGPSSITNPELSFDSLSGTYIGLFSSLNFDDYGETASGIALLGNPSSPTATNVSTAFSLNDYMNGAPSNGTIYKFSTGVNVGLLSHSTRSKDFSIYPNPSKDFIRISSNKINALDIQSVAIIDIKGQLIKQVNSLTDNKIDISDLNTGVYTVRITSNSEIINKKLIKE